MHAVHRLCLFKRVGEGRMHVCCSSACLVLQHAVHLAQWVLRLLAGALPCAATNAFEEQRPMPFPIYFVCDTVQLAEFIIHCTFASAGRRGSLSASLHSWFQQVNQGIWGVTILF